MNQEQLIELAREAIILTIVLSTPVMMVGLIVGVIIALVQALTQIQEITLVFVPKIIAIFAVIFLLFPAYTGLLNDFMTKIADKIVGIG